MYYIIYKIIFSHYSLLTTHYSLLTTLKDFIIFLIALFIALAVSTSTIILLRPMAPKLGLIDVRNHRKTHDGEIPLIGGIAMFFGLFSAVLFLYPLNSLVITWLLTSATIVLLGSIDDAKDLPVKFRLLIQAIVTVVLMTGTGFYLGDLGNLFWLGEINLGFVGGYLITIFAVIGAINAYNMMDGIDGLAGLMAMVSFSSLGLLFYLSGNAYGLYTSAILTVVLLPYLANNLLFLPRLTMSHKIFLGDAGAMLIGFSVVWLLIYGTQLPNAEASFRPVMALWVIAVPLLDMMAIIVRRLRRGQSPFKADRDHIHHLLMNTGLSARRTLMLLVVVAVLLASVGIIGEIFAVSDFYMMIGFIGIVFIYHKLIRVITSHISS